MRSAEKIFEALKKLREYAEWSGSKDCLVAVKKAENVALTEICGVNLDPENDNYDKVMSVVFPDFNFVERR